MGKEIDSGRTGHTSRTKNKNINNNSIKLFGVEITVNNDSPSGEESRNLMSSSSSKGIRWSEDEQRGFLIGLEKLGRGNWVGIAKDFVPSRTPTQVASHAQKYFDRQKDKRALKRQKFSVFDMNLDKESSTTTNTCSSPTDQSFTKEEATTSVVPLNNSNSKGKELLIQETPISPMPISYRVPPNVVYTASWVRFNGGFAHAYVPMLVDQATEAVALGSQITGPILRNLD